MMQQTSGECPLPMLTDHWELLKRINTGIVFVDRDRCITLCNPAAGQLLNAEVALGCPVPLEECLDPNGEEYKFVRELVDQQREYRNVVVTWEDNGRIRHVLIDSFKQEHESGVAGMYMMMKDVADFTALEQHMQRTDKLATVGKIAAGIAHEIRNPLTTIKGFLQMMEHRFRAQGMTAELQYIQVMLGEIERVNSLVSELLLLAKPHRAQKQPCSVRTLLGELNPLIESQALLRGIEYECTVEDVPLIIADPSLIKQVILNLVKNAMEAMENGGKLRVAVLLSSDHRVQIDVSDTGPGIPYYQIDKIFDAFYTTKEKGTGLGLPICQRIVAEHGGEIRVSSKGFGTTFSVLLPVAQSELPVAN
jgi:two-component system, sporulation sensor kinase E